MRVKSPGEKVTVLGIDPGTVVTGYGVVESDGERMAVVVYGEISSSPRLPLSRRLLNILVELRDLIGLHQPTVVAVENSFLAKNVQTAITLGQARAAALLAAELAALPVSEYTPREVKQAVSGYGAAAKEQVQGMVGRLLHLTDGRPSSHAADALAVAICHLHSARFKEVLAGSRPR